MIDSSLVRAHAHAHAHARAMARAIAWAVISSWAGALTCALAWIYDRAFISDRG